MEKTRADFIQMIKNVGVLALQSQLNQNQESIIDSLRSEIDQKIENAIQAQPDVSALIQKLIKLRRDANALPKDQLAFRPESSNGFYTEEVLTVERPEYRSKFSHPSSTRPVRQVRAFLGTIPSDNCSPRSISFARDVRNCR